MTLASDEEYGEVHATQLLVSPKQLLTPDDEPLVIIESDVLRTQENLKARGIQSLSIHIDADSTSVVNINGYIFNPGDTRIIDFDVDPFHGKLYLPVYSSVVGHADYEISVAEIKGVWCLAGFNVEGDHCERFTTTDEVWACSEPQYNINLTERSCTWVDVKTKGYECAAGQTLSGTNCLITSYSSGYSVCPSGYSGSPCTYHASISPTESCPSGFGTYQGGCRKTTWTCPSGYSELYGTGGCGASSYVHAPVAEGCPQSYPYSSWINSNTLLCTAVPYFTNHDASYEYAPLTRECRTGWTLTGAEMCDRTFTADREFVCPSGYVQVGSQCARTVTVAATPVSNCSAGWEPYGADQCRQTITSAPAISCPSGSSPVSSTSCSATRYKSSTYKCPAGYVDVWYGVPRACYKHIGRPACKSPMFMDEMDNCMISRRAEQNGVCPDSHPYLRTTEYGNSMCYANNSVPTYATTTPWKYCPDGGSYLRDGDQYCRDYSDTQDKIYTCSDGYAYDSVTDRCAKTVIVAKEYSCSVGALSNGQCVSYNIVAMPEPGCPPSYEDIGNEQCRNTFIRNAEPVCPADFIFDANDDNCQRLEVEPFIPLS